MLRLRAPTDEQLQKLLDRQMIAALTYEHVGATRDAALPHGYSHDRYQTAIDSFERAKDGLAAWRAHLDAGVAVYPLDAPLDTGTNVIVTARAGLIHALAPCRIVYTIDEPDRFGFAYGTLPGHPECGEEAFIVERDHAGRATFSIVAFSRPAELLARLGRPVARSIQVRVTHAYLDALCRFAAMSD